MGQAVGRAGGPRHVPKVGVIEWEPWYSVSLAEALVYGVTIEQAAASAKPKKARETNSITELASLNQRALVSDLPDTAASCIDQLQAVAVNSSKYFDK